ncbi:hypothetical protein GTQ99_04575 [Kineococcus sp. T13]|uniref:hypothetical protein n=1 Tax=Kineococcus vitellinus TaxID=2696565 RepID=UPI001412B381|nr:hypothetical protein [Kineococcus vitellinus]NAZ74698.1 hypothetical protein [Kineococcus vitellinus]
MLTVSITPRRLLHVLLAAAAALFLLNYAFLLLTAGLGVDAPVVLSARKFVDANTEMNLPAWFTSVLLAVVSLVVLDVARQAHLRRDRWRRHWAVLGAGFAYLSLDELVALHEKFIGPMSSLVGDQGVFKYAWVAAAGPVVLVLLLAYLRFLRALPRRTAALVVLGGVLYVGGSVGLEMVASALSGVGFSEDGVFLGTIMALEEVCEMVGPVVFLFAVAELVQRRAGAPGTAPLPAEVDLRDGERAGAHHPHAA